MVLHAHCAFARRCRCVTRADAGARAGRSVRPSAAVFNGRRGLSAELVCGDVELKVDEPETFRLEQMRA